VAAGDAPQRHPVIAELQERFMAADRAGGPPKRLRHPLTSDRHLTAPDRDVGLDGGVLPLGGHDRSPRRLTRRRTSLQAARPDVQFHAVIYLSAQWRWCYTVQSIARARGAVAHVNNAS
jgi:hypothetical protein